MNRKGILFCFVGPSGGGKTTYAQKLIKDDANCSFSVSLTTRAPRTGEVNGVDYEFVTREYFEKAVQDQELFEWEEVHGNYYGTRRSSVEEAIRLGKDLILDVDIKGAFSFKRGFPDNTVVIFLTPPSIEILKNRLLARTTITEHDFHKRLNTAKSEFASLLDTFNTNSQNSKLVDFFLINDDIDETYKKISAVVISERVKLLRFNSDEIASFTLNAL